MKIELGCGRRPTSGYVHHDRIQHSDFVDVAHDLDRFPWPWADASATEILALDVLEHVRAEVSAWLDECWRILQPGGTLILRLPSWDNPVSYRDVTHRRVFHEETFYFWDPDSPYWHYYGSIYYAESGRWWRVESVRRVNPDTRYGIGDLLFVLRKRKGNGDHQAG